MDKISALGGSLPGAMLNPVVRGTPLGDYLSLPNPDYHWCERRRSQSPLGPTIIEMDLVSQRWQGKLWNHRLVLIDPGAPARGASSATDTAMLYVTGSYDGGITVQVLSYFVGLTGAPSAVLYDVPNQPLFDDLYEDALVAYSFVQYLESGDPTWPALFPTTKSACAAMSAVQEWMGRQSEPPVQRFVVTGASKRGWTTWLAGAADPRVAGIAPLVFDNLNFPAQMAHQLRSWGAYSEEIRDYVETGLLEKLESGEGNRLSDLVDPYCYREGLSLPKLIINGINDRYWTVDAARFYFDDLPGEKHLLYVPNTGHNLGDMERVSGASMAFYRAVAAQQRLPDVSARFSGRSWDFEMAVESTYPPRAVRAWSAVSPTRDFRAARWQMAPLRAENDRYRYSTRLPDSGYVALFGEAEYEHGGMTYRLSSPLAVAPSIPGEGD